MSAKATAAVAAVAKPFRIGMLGAGTVGGGVYELITQQQQGLSTPEVVITKICVRRLDKPRDFNVLQHNNNNNNNNNNNDQPAMVWTTNPQDLLTDDIDCVVEVAGGSSGVAKDVVLAALRLGKAVVTANKALLAEHLTEIEQAANNSSSSSISGTGTASFLGFEAAVCGGIPIINALSTAYTGDTIQRVQGICNGTTNFMLSAMARDDKIQYATILQQAQELGYAEADPTADVEGHDVRAKLALLAKLAFGTTVPVHDIPCAGITKITSADFAYAKDELNCTIKLIGTATVVDSVDSDHDNEDDNAITTGPRRLSVYVTPTLVPLSHLLASIGDSGNAVSVTSHNLGTCHFTGPGAGRFPTAHSVVADIYRAVAVRKLPCAAVFPVPRSATTMTTTAHGIQLQPDYTADFYVRIPLPPSRAAATVDTIPMVALGKELGLEVSTFIQDGDNVFGVIPGASRVLMDKFCSALVEQLLACSTDSSWSPVSSDTLPLAMPIMK